MHGSQAEIKAALETIESNLKEINEKITYLNSIKAKLHISKAQLSKILNEKINNNGNISNIYENNNMFEYKEQEAVNNIFDNSINNGIYLLPALEEKITSQMNSRIILENINSKMETINNELNKPLNHIPKNIKKIRIRPKNNYPKRDHNINLKDPIINDECPRYNEWDEDKLVIEMKNQGLKKASKNEMVKILSEIWSYMKNNVIPERFKNSMPKE